MAWRSFSICTSFDGKKAEMSDAVHPSLAAGARPKVLLIGATNVGKTSVLLRYTGHGFAANQTPTIGAGFSVCSVPITRVSVTGSSSGGGDDSAATSTATAAAASLSSCGAHMELGVWDTAGQERYRAMMPLYYRNAAAAVVIYDVTAAETLDMAKAAHRDLMRYAPADIAVCVVGNKVDMESRREVPCSEGQSFAESISADFCETSALNGHNVEHMFCLVAQRLLQVFNDFSNGNHRTGGAADMVLSSRHDGVPHGLKRSRTCCSLM